MARIPHRIVEAYVRKLPGKYFTLHEVAKGLDIQEQTLRKWRRNGVSEAAETLKMLIEGQWTYLYDEAAVDRVRQYRDGRPPPDTPRMFTAEEIAERRRLRDVLEASLVSLETVLPDRARSDHQNRVKMTRLELEAGRIRALERLRSSRAGARRAC